MDDYREQYEKLRIPSSELSPEMRRRRGFLFERIIHTLLENEGLEPRTSYKAPGEQIDGSFRLHDRVYLLEAKWHQNALPASSIYQFKGKVDGKLTGTIGVFVSMSGYSEDAIDALVSGKVLNVILFDAEDFDSVFEDGVGFSGVLKAKLRFAAEEGNVYFPFNSRTVNARTLSLERNDISWLGTAKRPDSLLTEPIGNEIYVVCEGKIDREFIALLIQRILKENSLDIEVNVMDTMGIMNMPSVAESVKSLADSNTRILLVADADGNPNRTEEFFRRNLSFQDFTTILPNPTIESWLSTDSQTLQDEIREAEEAGKNLHEVLQAHVDMMDFEELTRNNLSFRTFYQVLTQDISIHVGQTLPSSIRITDEEDVPQISIDEQSLFNDVFIHTYRHVSNVCRERYTDFLQNKKYHDILKLLKRDPNIYRERKLDPRNPKSQGQGFYSELVFQELDKHYTRHDS